ncbi:MAG TPA: hypothetical protein VIS56_01720 [Candidatus Saccharimonadales bacterium]
MDQKQQIVDRLKQANNILVTVSNNPTVDQLASCLGLTLALNKMDKHATAVFSGTVPSTIEFLQPEKTIETNTDSLRDFIISLDKTKADKLRYKVEDKVVKIFITPYRTSISDKDLEFSQGDFNVDVVMAIGVHNQGDLDQAILAHGRILHDATVATINVKPGGELGGINWLVPGASSLSELAVDLIDALDKKMIDSQIATALLTGIVAETARFSNAKTSPSTMSISAELMAAGANQQLVATKLEEPAPMPLATAAAVPGIEHVRPANNIAPVQQPAPAQSEDGMLAISHGDASSTESADGEEGEEKPAGTPQIRIDEQGSLHNIEEAENKDGSATVDPTQHMGGSRMILQPPTMGGQMSASGLPDDGAVASDPLTLPQPSQAFGTQTPSQTAFQDSFMGSPASATVTPPTAPFMPSGMTPGAPTSPIPAEPLPTPAANPMSPSNPFAFPPAPAVPATDFSTQGIPSPWPASPAPVAPAPIEQPSTTHVDNARDAVMQAFAAQPADASRPDPIHALNAQPLGEPLHTMPEPLSGAPPDLNVPVPADNQSTGLNIPPPIGTPPPVPPPMMPQ